MEVVQRCGTKMAYRQDGHSVNMEEYSPSDGFHHHRQEKGGQSEEREELYL